MKNFFVDTNIILDWLIPTNRFHDEASNFIQLCFLNKANAFVSSHSLTDIFYVSRKYFSKDDRKEFLLLVVSNFQIITESKDDFLEVLRDTDFFDLEDGLQMKCAEKAGLDFIVTENLKDFENSKIPALDISAALEEIK